MCLYPKLIKNKKYIANKKNGGVIPPVLDKRTLVVPAGCGKCMECRKKKARDWVVRLNEEIRSRKNGKFVTLTFSNEQLKRIIEGEDTEGNKIIEKKTKKWIGKIKLEGYELDNEIATIATRRFLERWRKKYKKSVKHWLVTELGGKGTENIHMHGIIFTDESKESIEELWKYGHVGIGEYVNERTINYIVKYVSKVDEKHKEYRSKILTSSGIGKGYMDRMDSKRNTYNEKETKEEYRTRQGLKLAMPTYYRNKIYNEEERERLWIDKLDKEERWVDGIKIDVSENEEEYYKAVKEARKKSKELGYGDDEKNWDRIRYENERRNYNVLKRIEEKNNKDKSADSCSGDERSNSK